MTSSLTGYALDRTEANEWHPQMAPGNRGPQVHFGEQLVTKIWSRPPQNRPPVCQPTILKPKSAFSMGLASCRLKAVTVLGRAVRPVARGLSKSRAARALQAYQQEPAGITGPQYEGSYDFGSGTSLTPRQGFYISAQERDVLDEICHRSSKTSFERYFNLADIS